MLTEITTNTYTISSQGIFANVFRKFEDIEAVIIKAPDSNQMDVDFTIDSDPIQRESLAPGEYLSSPLSGRESELMFEWVAFVGDVDMKDLMFRTKFPTDKIYVLILKITPVPKPL